MKNLSLFPEKLVREPLFSLGDYQNIPREEAALDTFIDALYSQEQFAEAVYLASPSLHSEWGKVVRKEKKRGKINDAILKYYLRAISNTVPFGLFTSYSVLDKQQKTPGYQRYSTLDMEYLLRVIHHLHEYPIVRENVSLRKNNTLYKIGASFRFIEPQYQGGKTSYTLSSVDRDQLIDYLLEELQDGLSFRQLKKRVLTVVEGVDPKDVEAYLRELMDSKIYLSSLELSLNQPNPLGQLLDFYEEYQDLIVSDSKLAGVFQTLKTVSEHLSNLDKAVFNTKEKYEAIYSVLRSIEVPFDKKYVINSNLKKHQSTVTLDEQVDTKLSGVLGLLSKISKSTIKRKSNLDRFKENFYRRYEDAELPLVKVLDNELGIAYLPNLQDDVVFSDLIDDVTMPAAKNTVRERKIDTEIHDFWMNLMMQTPIGGTIDLKKVDLGAYKNVRSPKNGTFAMTYSVHGDQLFLGKVGGVSGANLLGRFSNTDREVQRLVKTVAETEKTLFNGAITAEVMHLPNTRSGNILMRHVQRDAELSILSKTTEGMPTIAVNDLYVSVKRNRVVLRSKRENKEVIPYLTSAQNFHYDSLPLYHFLCDLQDQDHHNDYSIDFGGFAIRDVENVPRISYGSDIVLRKASWLLKNSAYKNRFELLEDLKNRAVPRFVYITVFGEDKMIIDLQNTNTAKVLFDELLKQKTLRITECIYDVNEPGTRFANECISIVQSENDYALLAKSTPKVAPKATEVKRSFIYGDEWVYFKLYTGRITADQIVTKNIALIAQKLQESGKIDKWFFIRYADPDFHIRVRFHLKDQAQYGEVSTIIHRELATLLDEHKIWKLDLSTYNRELERYHWENIESSETIFHIDSEFTVALLRGLKQLRLGKRWLYMLKSIDDYFNYLGIDLERRHKVMKAMFQSFWIEYGQVASVKKDVNSKFRKYDAEITAAVQGEPSDFSGLYVQRLNALKAVELTPAAFEKREELVRSYIHMHVNRIIQANPRFHELIIYGLLERYYNKQLGKLKYSNKKTIQNETY